MGKGLESRARGLVAEWSGCRAGELVPLAREVGQAGSGGLEPVRRAAVTLQEGQGLPAGLALTGGCVEEAVLQLCSQIHGVSRKERLSLERLYHEQTSRPRLSQDETLSAS